MEIVQIVMDNALLHAANQAARRTKSKSRLGRRVAHLGPERMDAVCAALGFALGCGSQRP